MSLSEGERGWWRERERESVWYGLNLDGSFANGKSSIDPSKLKMKKKKKKKKMKGETKKVFLSFFRFHKLRKSLFHLKLKENARH